MRIPDRFLEHTVSVQPLLDVAQADGTEHGPIRPNLAALVVDRAKQVVDMRKDSETNGQVILAQTRVLMQPGEYVQPGSLVTVWPGEPMERTLQIVSTAYGRHSKAPNFFQAYLA